MGLPSNKAPGYDRVPLFVNKDYLSHILPILTGLINSSFANSVFLYACLEQDRSFSHLKNGDNEPPHNNRTISLLPVLSKVIERIVLNQFNTVSS